MREVIRQYGKTIISGLICLAMVFLAMRIPKAAGRVMEQLYAAEGSTAEDNAAEDNAASEDCIFNRIAEQKTAVIQENSQNLWCGTDYTAGDFVRIDQTVETQNNELKILAVWNDENQKIDCSGETVCFSEPGRYEILLLYTSDYFTQYIQITALINRNYHSDPE